MSLPSERSDEPAARRPAVDYSASQRAAAGDRFNWSIEAPRSDDLQGRISSSHVFPNAFPHGAECATEEREPGRASGHLLSITRAARTSLPIPRRGCRFPPPSRRSMISDSPCPSSTPLQTCTRSSRDSLHPVVWCRIGLWEKVLRTPEFPLPVFNSEEVCCFVELAGRLF